MDITSKVAGAVLNIELKKDKADNVDTERGLL